MCKILSLEALILKNLSVLKKCKTSEQKITLLEKILEENFGKFMPRNHIYEKLHIKIHRFRYFLDNSSYEHHKVGRRILVSTSSFAKLIYKDYKKILEDNCEI